MFRFKLGDTLLQDEPIGWRDFEETIFRDESLHGFTNLYQSNLTFVGDGYKILNDLFLNNYCAEVILYVDFICDGTYKNYLELLIKITDLDQNLERCTCEAKATDNAYYGMIHNNKDIPVRLSAEFSKNGVEIDPCPFVPLFIVNPVDGGGGIATGYPDSRRVYEQTEALAFVLRFITDNRIKFVQSDFLSSLTWTPEQFVEEGIRSMFFGFVSGLELREHSGQPVTLTFQGIVKQMYTLHNLFWVIRGDTMIVEPYDYFFETEGIKLPLLRDLIRSTDTGRIYNKVVFGSPDSEDERTVSPTYPDPLNYSMPFVDLIAHGKQEFPLTGVCQTETALDLVAEYSYDSNLIEKILIESYNTPSTERPNQDQDNNTFYIQYSYNSIFDVYFSVYSMMFVLPTTPIRGYSLNPYLWHSEVIKRHSIQGDLVIYQANNNDNFKATAEAPNAYVIMFHTILSYFGTSQIGTQTLNQISFYFGRPSWPIFGIGGGILNNAATPCAPPEITCTDPPVNIQFNNDSTNGNFDPNNNWDTTDYWFIAPSTGVYGFKAQLIINKLLDQISYPSAPDTYFPTSTYGIAPGDEFQRVIFNRYVDIIVYFTIFDSAGNEIGTTIAPFNGNPVEQWEIQDGIFSASVITAAGQSSNAQEVQQAIFEANYTIAQNTPQSWQFSKVVQRQHLVYMENNQRCRIRLAIRPRSHIKPLNTATRRVRYGVLPNSFIETFYIRTGGGSFEPVNPLLHRSLTYEFDRPLDFETWQLIKANPALLAQIGVGDENLTMTHVSRITRNIANGQTSFEMMANRNQPFI
jgi:hypothetical protein